MAQSAEDKANIRGFWENVRGNTAETGREALERTFLSFRTVKTYFPHCDLSPGSAQVRDQGRKVIFAMTDAVDNMDDLPTVLSALTDLHTHKLYVDPVNFRMSVLLAPGPQHYCDHVQSVPMGFQPAIHTSMEKFLDSTSAVLTSQYR